MKKRTKKLLSLWAGDGAKAVNLFALLWLSACASMGGAAPLAPLPAKPVDASRFFNGRWYEIARTPTSLTDGCVAGTTDFIDHPDGTLVERDECRVGSPEGRIKTFQGPIEMLAEAGHNEFIVHYTLYGFIPVSVTYWILDHADDYSWFIASNPSFKNVAILGRAPRQSPAEVAALTARVKAMGYDTAKLEFPETFPPGEN